MFNIGPMELIVVLISGIFVVGVPIAVIIVLVNVLRKSNRSLGGNWKAPPVGGPPTRIRALGAEDRPVAPSAAWDGSELVVKSSDWSTKSLFDVPLPDLEQCVITYRFRVFADNIKSAVYPEMWCRVPEKGQFFSRGIDRKVRGSANWTEVEIPFFLQNGQRADLLHLNLVFEGPGSVRLKDIEVLSTPLKASH